MLVQIDYINCQKVVLWPYYSTKSLRMIWLFLFLIEINFEIKKKRKRKEKLIALSG